MEVGDNIIGTVTKIVRYGVFMTFPDDYRGLLHISELSDKFVRDIHHFSHIGDELKVKILSIDEEQKFLRVSLKQVPFEEKIIKRANEITKKETREIKNVDFSKLQDKLDEWVDDALEEKKPHDEN